MLINSTSSSFIFDPNAKKVEISKLQHTRNKSLTNIFPNKNFESSQKISSHKRNLSHNSNTFDSSLDLDSPEQKLAEGENKKKRSIVNGRELLISSLEIIEELQNLETDSRRSPELTSSVNENLENFLNQNSFPLNTDFLDDRKKNYHSEITDLKLELREKDIEISKLRNRKHSNPVDFMDDLQSQIDMLARELNLLKTKCEKMALKNEKLEQLFALDKGDTHRSIENFYYMTLNKLTAFSIAILALSTNLVNRSDSWKDDLSSQVFVYLNNTSQSLGGAVNFFFGSGAILPLVFLPILSTTEFILNKHRDSIKSQEFQQAASYFSGGLQGIEERNQNIAHGLAYLLQMELRFCTYEGAERIVKDWLTTLCQRLMKAPKKESIDEINQILSTIFKGKKNNHDIETIGDRDWSTYKLFTKVGVAYPCYGDVYYESFYRKKLKKSSRTSEEKELTNSEKYGYFFFANLEEAREYKEFFKNNKDKDKKNISFFWKRDKGPAGPKISEKDTGHITSPTLTLTSSYSKKEPKQGQSLLPDSVSPPLEKLKAQIQELQKDKNETEKSKQELEVTMRIIEAKVDELMKKSYPDSKI